MRKFLAGVTALAVVAGAAVAEPGGGKGGGKGQGGGGGKPQQVQVDRGGGKGGGKVHAQHAQADRGGGRHGVERGGGRPDHGNAGAKSQGHSGQRADRGPDRAPRADKQRGPDRGEVARGNRGASDVKHANRGDQVRGHRGRADEVRIGRANDIDVIREGRGRGNTVRVVNDDGTVHFVGRDGRFHWDDVGPRGLVGGCPPGLAKKGTGCLPPGQFKKLAGWGGLSSPMWWGLPDFDDDDDDRFAYVNGYLVRLDDDGVDGWLPLLGGALAPGNLWPSLYRPVPLPPYYQDYYGLGPSYRYYDDVLYRVDPETAAITSIAALLTGDDFVVGQPMPLGYDIYNVPYGYRDRYVDGPDALYRYSDGYIYQVDPATRLIAAAIDLLV